MNNNPPKPKMTYAVVDHHVVRLAPGVQCPHCGREAQARDFEVRAEGTFWICQGAGCHGDILTVTSS
jgi:predicted RNA-binding Zn-ribbon protein involved in translation (DUF1610 family)